MSDLSEEKVTSLLGKYGANVFATLTGIFALGWAAFEGIQKLDVVFFRWVLCGVVFVVGVIYMKVRKYEKYTGVLNPNEGIIKRESKPAKFTSFAAITAASLYLIWSIGSYLLEKPLLYRYEHSNSGAPDLVPLNGESSEYWDLMAHTHLFTSNPNQFELIENDNTMTYRVAKSDFSKDVTIEKVVVTIAKIEPLPDLKEIPAGLGTELLNLHYYYNLPRTVPSGGMEVNPVFYEYKDGRKPWNDNFYRIDDDFPIIIKLHFAAKASGIYTIEDIELVLSRGFGASQKFSIMTKSTPRRLAFADTEDVVEYQTTELITRQAPDGTTVAMYEAVTHKKARGIPKPRGTWVQNPIPEVPIAKPDVPKK